MVGRLFLNEIVNYEKNMVIYFDKIYIIRWCKKIKYKDNIKIKFTLLETVFFLHTGIIGAVYVLYLLSTGMSVFQANMVSSIFNVATICFEVPSGALSDTIGKKKTAILAGGALFLSMVCFQIGINIGIIIVGQILWGISYSLESGTIEAWAVNEGNFKETELDVVFAFSKKVQSIAMIIGSIIGTWLADFSLNYIWAIPSITALIFIMMVLAFVKEDKKSQQNKKTIISLYKTALSHIKEGGSLLRTNKKLLYVFSFTILAAFVSSPLMIFWSVYLKEIDANYSYIYLSMVWILIQIAMIIGNQLLEYLGVRFRRKALFICLFMILGLSIIVMNVSKSFIYIVFLILIQEIIWAIISSMQRGLINDYIEDENRATMISYSSLFNSIGKVLASALFGLIADGFSIIFSWTVSGGLAFVLAVYVVVMYRVLNSAKELNVP